MLYPTGATIYMASRSKGRTEEAMKEVTSSNPVNASRLKFLHLDLDNLNIVRTAANTFLEQESRLDILWNNAGIGHVPAGSKTKQGIEAHMGVNIVGPLLFTQLLLGPLRAAASSSPKNSVRVIWTGSHFMEVKAPTGGYNLKDIENGGTNDPHINYTSSKAANWMLANPGNLKTHIYHTQPALMMFFVNRLFLHRPKLGAYTELFAGLSKEVTEKDQGAYIIPWGRIQPVNPRTDIYEAMEEGKGKKLWKWCEEQIKAHA
ncbi:putative oxidoreductase [Lachnellula suecica]|uniref:Putative oxidoreductase n=1 Tax=Lachnellula suecica TaxID=602035 RepID=A0A8T9C6H3_9HELO|nr:putative oxidoreductase [Lachnellula suecica]